MDWETVIGLEVHVQLRTRSKMFCGCATEFGARPNTNVCPVCLGLPGALPIPNRAAVRLGVRTALALGCKIHNVSVFERKGYFYPDLPKGYQISQFRKPLATSGRVEIGIGARDRYVRIGRLHLEEDAGKSMHDKIPGNTAVDFNRSGVPLAEIVSEPDLRSPDEARAYLTALKRLLQYLDVSDCNMEEGSLRVDANLSVRKVGDGLGVKQELKNLNSFSAVSRGLSLLRDRQIEGLEGGQPVAQQTFTVKGRQLSIMRTKEDSPDYRYFADPDLPAMILDESGIDVESERATLPELPWDRCARFQGELGLTSYAADSMTRSAELADYFEAVLDAGIESREAANWIMEVVLADANSHDGSFRVSPIRLAALIRLVVGGLLSKRAGKEVFAAIADEPDEPESVAEHLGLLQVSEEAQLIAWVDDLRDSYPEQVARFCMGESKLLDFFMGRGMALSKGRADPVKLRSVILERIGRPLP